MKTGLLAQLRKSDLPRAQRLGVLVIGTLLFALIVSALLGLRLNDSPSLPVGLYMVTSNQTATLMEFCPAEPYASLAVARGYRDEGNCPDGGAPLLKPIAARSGDIVELSTRGVAVNGKTLPSSTPLSIDTNGRPLLHWPFGTYRVQAGYVWVISSYNRRSFDSRYFGPLSVSSIRDRVRPVLTMHQ